MLIWVLFLMKGSLTLIKLTIMPLQPAPHTIPLRDLIRFSFWRFLFRITWLFFPAILFLLLSFACFWKLTQGKDLMVITIEKQRVFFYFIVAQIFWSYVTWYTTRLVGKAKEFEHPDDDRIWTSLRVQGPRLLAFTCYTIIILAFIKIEGDKLDWLPNWLWVVLFFLSLPFYFFIYKLWDRFTNKETSPVLKRKFLLSVQTTTWIMLAAGMLFVVIFKSFIGLIVLLFALQQALVLLLIIRRKLIDAKGDSFFQKSNEARGFTKSSSLWEKMKGLVFDNEDNAYFKFFIVAAIAAAIIYLSTVFSVSFAVNIGSFPFVLIAFAVLLLLGNTVAFISVLKNFNFHIFFIGLAFLIGLKWEPHYVNLPEKKIETNTFRNRQNLKEYFTNWVNDSARKKILDDSSVTSYPVIFALANGGASRSGYWVASVLSKLEDTTHGSFSQHLFCLSGASGGSVGNAAFFSLLRSKNELLKYDTTTTPFYNAAIDYLGSDFLTYTLARMLGPDVFRHIVPSNVYDRAAALSYALEKASGNSSFLYDSLSVRFSQIITQKEQTGYKLPVLCINTTRMQDGSPAVMSNIDLGDAAFNKRIDVLKLLDEKEDMKLSTAVVLGASFPYVSPAGRINTKVPVTDKEGNERVATEPQYFVDGGYFDNSGAGVVNEMIIILHDILNRDTALNKYANKIQFYIAHISNDPVGDNVLSKVNPIVNDLAAPLKTLMGAYGSQTAVNDRRLQNYIKGLYNDNSHYININLYKSHDPTHYSMNWVISNHLLKAMNERLHGHEGISTIMQLLR
jgi:predicted acylesterase/phospholipase RssA